MCLHLIFFPIREDRFKADTIHISIEILFLIGYYSKNGTAQNVSPLCALRVVQFICHDGEGRPSSASDNGIVQQIGWRAISGCSRRAKPKSIPRKALHVPDTSNCSRSSHAVPMLATTVLNLLDNGI